MPAFFLVKKKKETNGWDLVVWQNIIAKLSNVAYVDPQRCPNVFCAMHSQLASDTMCIDSCGALQFCCFYAFFFQK